MGTPWTDESAILRDLSFAQGRWVPGGIDTAIAGANPPTHNIKEETEEEYFRHWTCDGDFTSGPDLMRIKKMLEIVQDQEVPEEELYTGPIQISKLNPAASMFVPKRKDNIKDKKPNKPGVAPGEARNVAIASILALASQVTTANPGNEPVKLAKPEDFIQTKQEIEIKTPEHDHRREDSVNKVTDWLQSQDITTMFKRKSSLNSNKQNNELNNNTDGGTASNAQKSPANSEGFKSPSSPSSSPKAKPYTAQYKPSSWAKEYYKKAVDRSHMRDLVQEDIWSRAEKLMKDIDIKKAEALRKQQEQDEALAAAMAAAEAEPGSTAQTSNADLGENKAGSSSSSNADLKKITTEDLDENKPKGSGLASVVLVKTRHELYNSDHTTCVVCKVLTVPLPSGQSTPKNNETPKEFISDDERSYELDPDCIENTYSKESSDESDEVNRYFGLVRTSIVENLFEADVCVDKIQ